ncbi:hypothetical protein SEA_THUMB_94 [Mycobacterium phage Thumb]|nr:hypothetical protein SEA_THUMB_94 [Mycobacterium phage Thumb]
MKSCDNCNAEYNEEATEESMKIVVEFITDFLDTGRSGLARMRGTVYLCPKCAEGDIVPCELSALSRNGSEFLGWIL